MRREILRQLQSEYEERRQENDRIFFERRAEAERKSPEIGRLMDARQDLIFSSVRGIIMGNKPNQIPEKMAEITEKIRSLLTENGFSRDYLEPVYRCPLCRDTGYVGEPVREMCSCMQKELTRRLYAESGLGDQREQTYDTFRLDVFPDTVIPGLGYSQRQMMEMIRDMTKAWAEQWPDVRENCGVIFSGASGLGKTFLLHAMAGVMLDRGLNVMVLSSYRAQEIMRKAYFSRDGQDDLDLLMNTDVLFLDDLGTEPLLDNVTVSQFFNLFNERQNHQKACVISTNLSLKNLRERYTERIASRLLDSSRMMVVEMRGEDIRRNR